MGGKNRNRNRRPKGPRGESGALGHSELSESDNSRTSSPVVVASEPVEEPLKESVDVDQVQLNTEDPSVVVETSASEKVSDSAAPVEDTEGEPLAEPESNTASTEEGAAEVSAPSPATVMGEEVVVVSARDAASPQPSNTETASPARSTSAKETVSSPARSSQKSPKVASPAVAPSPKKSPAVSKAQKSPSKATSSPNAAEPAVVDPTESSGIPPLKLSTESDGESPRTSRRRRMQCFLDALVTDALKRCPGWMRTYLPTVDSLRKLNLSGNDESAESAPSTCRTLAMAATAIPLVIAGLIAAAVLVCAGGAGLVVMLPFICLCSPFLVMGALVCCGGGLCVSGIALTAFAAFCGVFGVVLMCARHLSRRAMNTYGPAEGSVLYRICTGIDETGEAISERLWNRLNSIRGRN